MQLVVSQQLDGALEVAAQCQHGETRTGGLVHPDLVQGPLKGQPVQRRGAVAKHATQHLADAFLAGRRLEGRLVPYPSVNAHRVARGFGLDNEPQPVGQCLLHRVHVAGRHRERPQYVLGPRRQLDGLGLFRRERLRAAEPLARDRLARRLRGEDGPYRGAKIHVFARHAIHVFHRNPAHEVDVVLRRLAAFHREGLGPGHGQVGNRVPLQLQLRHLTAFGGQHQILRQALFGVAGQDALDLLEQRGWVSALGELDRRVPQPGVREEIGLDAAGQRLAVCNQRIEVAALAVQHVGEQPGGWVVRTVVARQPEGNDDHPIGAVGLETEGLRSHRLEPHRRPFADFLCRDRSEQLLHLAKDVVGIHVPNDHQDGIVGRIPPFMESLEHGPAGLIEGLARAKGVMGVGRAPEQGRQQLRVQDVVWTGQVLGDLLLDRAPLLVPGVLAVRHASHADSLDAQRGLQVLRGNCIEVLRHSLLGVGIRHAPHDGVQIGELGRRKPGAAAEHHVLLRVGHAGKPLGRLVGACQIVHLDGSDGGEGTTDDDDAEPVLQRRAQHVAVRPQGGLCGPNPRRHAQERHQQAEDRPTPPRVRQWPIPYAGRQCGPGVERHNGRGAGVSVVHRSKSSGLKGHRKVWDGLRPAAGDSPAAAL